MLSLKKMFFLVSLFATSASFAVLPPFYQTTKEIKAILNDERLAESLGSGESILEIKRVEDGYEIMTTKYSLHILVNYVPRGYPGPAIFSFEFLPKEERIDSE
jgi:hypothetical protein